jgi:hypothetical protein
MVSSLSLRVVDRGFDPLSSQTKDYTICICCFSKKHTSLGRKSKDWLMGPSEGTCLPAGCCFSELAL